MDRGGIDGDDSAHLLLASDRLPPPVMVGRTPAPGRLGGWHAHRQDHQEDVFDGYLCGERMVMVR